MQLTACLLNSRVSRILEQCGGIFSLSIILSVAFGTPAYSQKISCEDAREMAVLYAQNLEKSRSDVEVQLAQLNFAYKKLQVELEDYKKKYSDVENKSGPGKKE